MIWEFLSVFEQYFLSGQGTNSSISLADLETLTLQIKRVYTITNLWSKNG